MKILGIDPGTTRIGYGLIDGNKSNLKLLDYGTLEIPSGEKLSVVGDKFSELLDKFRPNLVAIEKLFFAKNRKTALAVAQTRGAIILKVQEKNLPILEFSPNEVKLAVASYGNADKKAVAFMVKKFLGVSELKGYDDASDALAIAITAAGVLPRTEPNDTSASRFS